MEYYWLSSSTLTFRCENQFSAENILDLAAQKCNKSYLVLRLNKQNTQEYFLSFMFTFKNRIFSPYTLYVGGREFQC